MEKISKHIIATDGEAEFQLLLIKEESVGLLKTVSGKSYLILDSGDFWHDLVQTKKPRKAKCNCKNDWFRLRFEYLLRKGAPDIKQVNIISTCTACFMEKRQFSIEIDYSPSLRLIDDPLSYCEQPFIKYDLSEINCYWTNEDLKRLFLCLSVEMKLKIFCWFWQRADNKRHFCEVTLDKAVEIVTVNHRYLGFYFSKENLSFDTKTYDDDAYVEDGQWRKHELFELSSPFVIAFDDGRKGLLFYIRLSTQYIENGRVVDKSEQFKSLASNLKKWFMENYTMLRGNNCFDNKEEHERIFGDRFTKKKIMASILAPFYYRVFASPDFPG